MYGPSHGLASSSSSLSPLSPLPSDHRNWHYDMIIAGGGAVGSALTRMLLDDMTAALTSAPDSDGSLRQTRVVVIVFVAVAIGPRQKSTAATRLPSRCSPMPRTPPPSSPQIIGSDSICDPLSCVASGSISTLPII